MPKYAETEKILRPLRFFEPQRAFFSIKELITILSLVCRSWHEIVISYHFPYRAGFITLLELISKIKDLKPEFLLPRQVLSSNQTLSYAEDTMIMSNSSLEKKTEFLSKNGFDMTDDTKKNILCTESGIYAVRSKILTQELVELIPADNLRIFLTKTGLRAIEDRLITLTYQIQNPEKFASLIPCEKLKELVTKQGLKALRKQLLFPNQLEKMGVYVLQTFLSDGKHEFQIECGALKKIIYPNGLDALRKKLISIQSASHIKLVTFLFMLTTNGIQALEEELLTLEEADMLNFIQLADITTDLGLQALKRRVIKVKACIYSTKQPLTEDFLESRIQEMIAFSASSGNCCSLQ